MAVIYKVAAITGKYTDNDGNEKNRYADLGVVVETKNGPMLKLESVPVGWDGWAYLNEPKEAQGVRKPQRPSKPAVDDFQDDDLPF